MLARGIHRTMFGFLIAAAVLGAVAGSIGHAALGAGSGPHAVICVALTVLLAAWPLGWMATWRIVKPLRDVAKVANDLQKGQLDRRRELPDAPGAVGEVADALREMAERLSRQLREQRALMAAVSHELRSPLGRARVLVEMAQEGSAPATLYADLEAEIVGMDELVGDLLAAARIELEAVAPRALDVRDLARRACEIARVDAELVEEGSPGALRADATLLARALAALVDNARRYGGQRVLFRIVDRGDTVRFEVDDDGPGFAAGDEERAFEPFWRGSGTDGRTRGVGLGLALVRQIAEAHRGTAGATNHDGGGRVWMELPRD